MHLLLEQDKNRPACYLENQILTYGQLQIQVDRLSSFLSKQGIMQGMRVAMVAIPTIHTVLTLLSLLHLGASACLLSIRLPPDQITAYARQAKASCFLHPSSLEHFSQSHRDAESLLLLFTSGSTGTPKLACLSPNHFLSSARDSVPHLQITPQSIYQVSTPLFHVSGLSILFRCLVASAAISFHPLHRTHLSFVPTQLLRFLQEPQAPLPVQCILLGGAPLHSCLITTALQKELPIRTTYGMTETASQITVSDHEDPLCPIHAGKLLPNKEIKIAPDGEILLKANSLFYGYDSDEGPILPLTEDGWFPTKDLGAFLSNGNLVHLGRKDNIFISGGENISPEVIERAIASIAPVLQVFVIPRTDPEFGARPVAFVQMDGVIPSRQEWKDRLTPLLPSFQIPIQFLPIPESCLREPKVNRSSLLSSL